MSDTIVSNEDLEVRRAEMRAQADKDLDRKMAEEKKSEEIKFLRETLEVMSKAMAASLSEMYQALRRLGYLQPSYHDEDEEDFNMTMEYGYLAQGIGDLNQQELEIVNRVLSMLVWVRRDANAPRPLPMPTT